MKDRQQILLGKPRYKTLAVACAGLHIEALDIKHTTKPTPKMSLKLLIFNTNKKNDLWFVYFN